MSPSDLTSIPSATGQPVMTKATVADWAAVAAQRTILADQLDRLEPGHWDQPSLCRDWRVRHVVAHMIGEATAPTLTMIGGLVRHGFRLDAFIRADALRRGESDAAELAAAYRATIALRTGPPGITPATALVDVVCHASDIMRPLGRPTPFDPRIVAAAARRLASVGYPIGARKRVRSLRLVATDTEFDLGTGPVVEGPIEAILLAMGGRPAGISELNGPGRSHLAKRL